MPVRYQLVVDCTNPTHQAHFWAAALHYQLAPSPPGFTTWDAYYRDLGIPQEALTGDTDRISDPQGGGPDIWFQPVQDPKTVKNRLHIDIHASGTRADPIQIRKKRVNAEADRLVALGATITHTMYQEGIDHYAIAMKDPEGNEFDIN